MQKKSEELLGMLLWTCDILSRPTWRNLTDSYESWMYRNGFYRQLLRLEQKALIDHLPGPSGVRLHCLTQSGRLRALGGRDPDACWNRRWDGRWRMVLFDVPRTSNTLRDRLRRYLQRRGFGYLQNSVWITPGPMDEERQLLGDAFVDVESMIWFKASPCAGETDAEIVAGAWDFVEINQGYERYLELLEHCPRGNPVAPVSAGRLSRWLRAEREAWLDAVSKDPLLPRCLLPRTYLGTQAWRQRREIMTRVGERIRKLNRD
jgi:phenylacetic acid degradation operon negative regulatory protein